MAAAGSPAATRTPGAHRFWTRVIPTAVAKALVETASPGQDKLRDLAFRRAAQSPWGTAAVSTLHAYREASERREHRRK